MDIRPISYDYLLEHQELMQAHYDEVWGSKLSDQTLVLPDSETYRQLESQNMFVVLGGFIGDKLIGYATGYYSPYMHNIAIFFGTIDSIYLRPEHRKGINGAKLLKAMMNWFADIGVDQISINVSIGTAADKLLSRLGYKPTEHHYLINSQELNHGRRG